MCISNASGASDFMSSSLVEAETLVAVCGSAEVKRIQQLEIKEVYLQSTINMGIF